MMNSHTIHQDYIEIRNVNPTDIKTIATLVGSCGPYLSNYPPYIFFVYSRCFTETCLVAILDGSIVGFCSAIPFGERRFYLHQLAVSPAARGRRIGFELLGTLLMKLKAVYGDEFSLQFTLDRRNTAVHRLMRRVGGAFDMTFERLPEDVPPLEEGCIDELFEFTPLIDLETQIAFVA